MSTVRRKHSAEFKSKVAVEALRELRTMNELSSTFGIHANQISQWKKQLQDKAPSLFGGYNTNGDGHDEKTIAKLYEEIGRLKVELDWLKKRV